LQIFRRETWEKVHRPHQQRLITRRLQPRRERLT